MDLSRNSYSVPLVRPVMVVLVKRPKPEGGISLKGTIEDIYKINLQSSDTLTYTQLKQHKKAYQSV